MRASSASALRRRPRPGETLVHLALFACGALSVLTTVGIVLALGTEAAAFFREVSIFEYLFGTTWSPSVEPQSFGVLPLVTGTMMVASIAGLVGVPLGIATALYLSEYAPRRVRRKVKPVLEILAGMPTVVLGYFALSFVTAVVIRSLFPGADVFNGLSAGIVVGILIVPTIASISEDAMASVPQGLRQGAYALGASKMSVSLRVVIPAAFSGVTAAVILGISRAVGETMIVAIAAGQTPLLHFNPLQSIHTMTGYIVQVSLGDTPHGSIEYQAIFAVGLLLFAITFVLNLFSQKLVRRFREIY